MQIDDYNQKLDPQQQSYFQDGIDETNFLRFLDVLRHAYDNENGNENNNKNKNEDGNENENKNGKKNGKHIFCR